MLSEIITFVPVESPHTPCRSNPTADSGSPREFPRSPPPPLPAGVPHGGEGGRGDSSMKLQ